MYLSNSIAIVQKYAFRTIYPGISYSDAMEIANVRSTLHQRRVNLCNDYFNHLKNKEHQLHNVLPPYCQVPHSLRDGAPPVLPEIRTQRYFNSFVPWGVRIAYDGLFYSQRTSLLCVTTLLLQHACVE